MSTLYELTSSFMQIQNMIEESKDGLEDTLESIELALDDKLENTAKVIRNLEGEILALKNEEKRLSDRRKSIENNIKYLKQYAENAMLVKGAEKVKTGIFTFSMQKNPPSVGIYDESKIPKKYYVPTDPKLDKKAITEALKNGESVGGTELIQNKTLRIK